MLIMGTLVCQSRLELIAERSRVMDVGEKNRLNESKLGVKDQENITG